MSVLAVTAAFLPSTRSPLFVYSLAIVSRAHWSVGRKRRKKNGRSAAVELLKGPVHLEWFLKQFEEPPACRVHLITVGTGTHVSKKTTEL